MVAWWCCQVAVVGVVVSAMPQFQHGLIDFVAVIDLAADSMRLMVLLQPRNNTDTNTALRPVWSAV
jgi:hypothetical protein